MANTVYVKVDNLDAVLASYDKIKVYKSATINGTYTEITSSGTRPSLDSQDTLYTYVDNAGISTDFYEASYFNSISLSESALSAPIAATPLQQLQENMIVTVSLSGDIADVNGNKLTSDGTTKEYYFTTVYDPMYSAIRRIRLDIGAFLKDIPDDTINLAIFEASREADQLTWDKTTAETTGNTLYVHARRQWTSYKAEQILLSNIMHGAGGLLKEKRLADFNVEYDTFSLKYMLDKIDAYMQRWEGELRTGGRAIQRARAVIKGSHDIDRPGIGREWDDWDQHPLANAQLKYRGSRRFLTTYWPRVRR